MVHANNVYLINQTLKQKNSFAKFVFDNILNHSIKNITFLDNCSSSPAVKQNWFDLLLYTVYNKHSTNLAENDNHWLITSSMDTSINPPDPHKMV